LFIEKTIWFYNSDKQKTETPMKNILLIISLLISILSFAQKEEKKTKEDLKYFYKEVTLETDDYNVYIMDAVAVGKQSKFKIKIFNKTNDYLLVKPSEMNFKSGEKIIFSTDKTFVVQPNEEEAEVIDFKGTEMLVDKYLIEINGIYKASAGGQIIRTPSFNLPPTKNQFTIGNFNCTLKKSESTTAKAFGKFDCLYTGDGIGIINANKCIAIMPNGTDNPNAKKNKILILEKGKSDDFTAVFNEVAGAGDLQKKSIAINWNETFRESKVSKLNSSKIELVRNLEKK
jgi:hypothetical protein